MLSLVCRFIGLRVLILRFNRHDTRLAPRRYR